MPQRPRCGYAAGLPRSLPSSINKPPREFPVRHEGQVRVASGPDPPGSSRCKIVGRKRRFLAYSSSPRLPGTRHLAVLTRPGFVRAASRPSRRHPGQAALSFSGPLRRAEGAGLSPPLELPALSRRTLMILQSAHGFRCCHHQLHWAIDYPADHQDDQGQDRLGWAS